MQPLNPHSNSAADGLGSVGLGSAGLGSAGLGSDREPKLVSHTHYCVMGDVTVDSTAAIAPGVVLQASPGSRIIISSGACLAGGVCIQSRNGILTIGSGVNLGANVLVIGNGTIGDCACVSPGCTVLNPQLDTNTVVPPGSMVGAESSPQKSRSTSTYSAYTSYSASVTVNQSVAPTTTSNNTAGSSENEFVNTFVEPGPIGPKAIETPDLSDQNGQFVESAPYQAGYGYQNNGVQLNGNHSAAQDNGQGPNRDTSNSSALSVPSNDRVYGRDQVSQLLSTLFPHRNAP
ncbi:MAG: hypothetical protein AAFP09_11710 [Cyanobacteria bacterium J06607_10]